MDGEKSETQKKDEMAIVTAHRSAEAEEKADLKDDSLSISIEKETWFKGRISINPRESP